MNYEFEKEYIKKFIADMTEEELIAAMKECGNETIMSTQDILQELKGNGFYDISPQYKVRSNYMTSGKSREYDKFTLVSDSGQGAAA